MILLIHGNDIASSRNFYFAEKNKLIEPILLNGDGLTYNQIFQSLENKTFFDTNISLLIENFFSKNKTNSIESKKIIDYINSNKNLNIIFWESGELSKTASVALKDATTKTFSFPQILFTFLDNLKPNNSTVLVKMAHELSANMEIELIFFMLVRQFRIMLSQIENGVKIDEIKRMAPWQLSKMQRQAESFGKEKLKEAYQKLFDIDLGSKTGKIPYSLERSIDFFLAGL